MPNLKSFCVRVFNLRSCQPRMTWGRAPLWRPQVRPLSSIFEQYDLWTEPKFNLRWIWVFCMVIIWNFSLCINPVPTHRPNPYSLTGRVDSGKVDSGIGLPNAHGKWVGVDSGVDIRWGYSQLRHRVLYTMFFCGFGLSTRHLCQAYGSWTHIHMLMSIMGLEISCRRCKIYSELFLT